MADPAIERTQQADLGLSPSVRQEQILSPQLRASLRVLQMDWTALVAEIRHEAETNPVVELEGPSEMSPISTEMRSKDEDEVERGEGIEEDDSNPSVSIDEEAAERRQRFFDQQVASESLQEHLLAQVKAAGFAGDEFQIAELIVGDIDDDGRYVGSLDDLVSVMNSSEEKVLSVLRRVQTFDPPGVGGRNLRECLEIQARQLDVAEPMRNLVLGMIEKCLSMVARRSESDIMDTLGASAEDCQEAMRVLRSMDPKPGRPFVANGRHPQIIRPELEVDRNEFGLSLNSSEHELPTLKINPVYRDMAADKSTAKETRRYLSERIGSAELLQDAIRRRGETVLRVAEAVFSEQYEFFDHGFEALRPLTIEEIARRTGYHGTTVGRAVRGKYVKTPRGVFELRQFFCVGRYGRDGGAPISAVAVKCRLADMIREEVGTAMTDEELSQALGKCGMAISRRTVAKYRFELGIPSAVERERRRRTV